jgi:hypothetical protein
MLEIGARPDLAIRPTVTLTSLRLILRHAFPRYVLLICIMGMMSLPFHLMPPRVLHLRYSVIPHLHYTRIRQLSLRHRMLPTNLGPFICVLCWRCCSSFLSPSLPK